jgi:hypothetical protein
VAATKWLIIGGSILLAGALGFGILAAYSEPILRERAIRMLERRFDSNVELASLRVSLWPGIGATGTGLVLHRKDDPAGPPLIAIKSFSLSTGLMELLRPAPHIHSVRLDGLEITVAAHHDGRTGLAADGGPHIEVGEIDTDDALLRILPRVPAKEPLLFNIHRLTMRTVARNQPMSFVTTLRNAKPPGEIHSAGNFGPWQEQDPGLTPVSGSYTFENANLGVFKGISGILASRGKYGGTLDHIDVKGDTDTPDFTVRVSGHPVDLKTTFHSIVDGTNGDTLLQPVDAHFGHSTIHCEGGVVHDEGEHGKTVSLNIAVIDARIEDLLRLAVKSDKPVMTGAVHFHAKFELPPGDRDIPDRLNLDGTFGVGGAHFTNSTVQEKVASLSHRAQGRPDETGGTVASDLKGSFILKDGVITFSRLSFGVPGADIVLIGDYNLDNERIDFRGTARMQAELSQMTTGWKSMLLKIADPFFRKNGAGTVIPFKITGTRENPSFGLDFRKP